MSSAVEMVEMWVGYSAAQLVAWTGIDSVSMKVELRGDDSAETTVVALELMLADDWVVEKVDQ